METCLGLGLGLWAEPVGVALPVGGVMIVCEHDMGGALPMRGALGVGGATAVGVALPVGVAWTYGRDLWLAGHSTMGGVCTCGRSLWLWVWPRL